ncbi:hypothetical protein ACF08M_30010 [Streptomyces sp. NPDC015032]|uniref:hypothetical protein n=1 Tax=Streptomyces sp. NPDC015032 TaxID=3364937 RepID=UPI0036FB0CAC
MNTWEKAFADADTSTREPRRPFDVGAGLRRIAQDAGYVRPAPLHAPRAPGARRRLGVMARWSVTQAGAAAHMEELAALLGDDDNAARFDGWTPNVDIDGVQVFACMLYLAHQPESARFWWRFAAGAGHGGAAYCLYLDHLGLGEDREARFWKRQVTTLFRTGPIRTPAIDPDEFLEALETFTGYSARHYTCRTVPTRRLEAEFERLADQDTDGLVCRPDARLADRIHELASQ